MRTLKPFGLPTFCLALALQFLIQGCSGIIEVNIVGDSVSTTPLSGSGLSPGPLPSSLPQSLRHIFTPGAIIQSYTPVGSSLYVGGSFTRVAPTAAGGLIALDINGHSKECNFGDGFDDEVYTVASHGGYVYVGGEFTHYQGQSANRIAKISLTDCTLDTSFSPPLANGFNGEINAIVIPASNPAVYVGGSFSQYAGSQTAWGITKLDLNGTLDTTFSPQGGVGQESGVAYLGSAATVLAIYVDAAGTTLFIGGDWTSYQQNGITVNAQSIAKLNATNGAIDVGFNTGVGNGFDGDVSSITADASLNSLYASGDFNNYTDQGSPFVANRIAKLDLTTGAIDTTFSPQIGGNGFNDYVSSLAIDTSNSPHSLYVGGDFSSYRGTSRNYLAKLNASDGTLDLTFAPSIPAPIYSVTRFGSSVVAGMEDTGENGIVKVNPSTGAADTSFKEAGSDFVGFDDSESRNEVWVVFASDSTLFVGGSFKTYGGKAVNHIVKLNADTLEVDTTFSPPGNNGFNGSVNSIVASSTAVYVGGNFTTYRGTTAKRIAKLDLNGVLDPSFAPDGFNNNVQTLVLTDTALFCGGSFTTFGTLATPAQRIAKIDLSTGVLDGTFSTAAGGFNNNVLTLAYSAGELYAGGSFTSYNSTAIDRLVKINATTGAIIGAFASPGFDLDVHKVIISGSSVYVGGAFTADTNEVSTASNRKIAKLDATTGALDTNFQTTLYSGSSNTEFPLTLAVSGNSLFVGGYRSFNGLLAKLNASTGALDTAFSPGGNALRFSGRGGVVSVRDIQVIDDSKIAVSGAFDRYTAPGSAAPSLVLGIGVLDFDGAVQ